MDADSKPTRVILHVDMDAFYASVEQRDFPELRGKPVIVGGPSRRGVVSTCSYEARPYGVHSAMPMGQALRLCPHALVVPGRMKVYGQVSHQIMDVMANFTPMLEALSLDEAFLDMTGCEKLFGPPDAIARQIKDAIYEATQLHCSVGIGCNKFLAKLASDLDKPDGITWVPPGREREFIAPLGIRKLWGVGPKSAAQLQRLGVLTIGQLADYDPQRLVDQLGERYARHLQALAQARDVRRVQPERRRKSVGSETTLEHDIRGRPAVEPVLRRQCMRVARMLRGSGLLARGIRVKLRYSRNFTLKTRQLLLPDPCDDSATISSAALELLERFDVSKPIRLVGAAAFELLDPASSSQLNMFTARAPVKQSQLEHAVDAIRGRFGDKIRLGIHDSDDRFSK